MSIVTPNIDSSESSHPAGKRSWVFAILVFVGGPLGLLWGAEYFGANPFWVVLGPSAIIGVWAACIMLVVWGRRGLRRSVRIFLIGLVCVSVAIVWVCRFSAFQAIDTAGTYVHFVVHRHHYETAIAQLTGHPKLAVFPRGGLSWLFEAIVYDDSDEVLRRPEDRSSEWTVRASMTELSCSFKVRPLGGHFYAARFFC